MLIIHGWTISIKATDTWARGARPDACLGPLSGEDLLVDAYTISVPNSSLFDFLILNLITHLI